MPTLEDLRRQRQERLKLQQPIAPVDTTSQLPIKSQHNPALPSGSAEQVDSLDFNWKKPPTPKYDTPEWEAARNNPQLLDTIKRYAKNVDDKSFVSDDDAFDWFVSDRRWKDSNTVSALTELNFAKGAFGSKYASKQDLEDLAVIRSEWEKLPGGFERIFGRDIAGGTGAILQNIARGFVDPSILLGGWAGKAAGGLVSKGVSAGIGKTLSAAAQQTVKKATQVGASVATDAAISAGANVAYQETNVEAGLQNEVDGWEAAKAGMLGGVLSAPGAYMTFNAPAKGAKADPMVALEQSQRVIGERRAKGLPGLYGKDGTEGSLTLPDGRRLSLNDIETSKDPKALLQSGTTATPAVTPEAPVEVDFSNFSRTLAKDIAKTRKVERDAAKAAGKAGGRSRLVPNIVEADQTAYDPLLDSLSVKAGAKLDEAAGTALRDLTKHDVDVNWRKESLQVTVEDGTKIKVTAGDVANSLRNRTKQADDLLTCLGT